MVIWMDLLLAVFVGEKPPINSPTRSNPELPQLSEGNLG